MGGNIIVVTVWQNSNIIVMSGSNPCPGSTYLSLLTVINTPGTHCNILLVTTKYFGTCPLFLHTKELVKYQKK